MKSYLKFLSRNKLYTAIEAVGLAVSLAFVILIGSYVVQQYEVAHESPDWKRTFVLGTDESLGLCYWDKEELEMNIPEVEAVTHVAMLWQPVIEVADDSFRGSGMDADAAFFEVFPQYELIEGSATDFVGKTDVLVSESLARRIAGEGESLVGTVLKVDDKERTVKGVFADFDGSFFMPYDVITHISDSYGAYQPRAFNSIGSFSTWYKVREDADLDDVNAKIKALIHKNYDPTWTAERVEKWHPYRMDEAFFHTGSSNGLTRSGNRQMLQLLTVVVLLLLLSAIFNYVNLSLALTAKRSREMATRRLLGEEKSGILWKYISESLVFTSVCFVVALLLAWWLTPMMNSLVSTVDTGLASVGMTDTGVKLTFLVTPGYIAAYIVGVLFLGTLCGLLPAVAASRYEPLDVLKGTLRRRNKMVLSRVLIVVQNVLAVFLIAMALVMEVQMRHMLRRPLHAAVDDRYYIECTARGYDEMKLLKDKVEQLPFVTEAGTGRGLPGFINMTMFIKAGEEQHVAMPLIICDTTYFKLLGLEVKEDFGHPLLNSLWMTETAFRAANVSDTSTVFPRMINMNGAHPEFIGGTVTDFPTRPASELNPNPNGGVIVDRADKLMYANSLLIGTTGEDKSYNLQIRQAYQEFRRETVGTEDNALMGGFVRDIVRQQLEPVRRTLRLVELFAVLSVIIALLGLLAMSTYFADENTKQIAVRKVFGADVDSETRRNVRGYMILTGIACAIGIPLAVWAASVYLERFSYRIEGYGWVFVVAVIISLAIAFGTVLWQTLKAARTNPAIELKKE
ncbi:MAG: FtsX-like permease family protein [Bacteroidales bacterium]|nr:FtsX-like permease family protein [Bacteroidales bacterium]